MGPKHQSGGGIWTHEERKEEEPGLGKWDFPLPRVRCGVRSSRLRGACEDPVRKNLQGQENWVSLPVARPGLPRGLRA